MKELQKKYFLVGFMGVGKTTIGKQLASALQLPFVDIDRQIEQQEGMTISEIFEGKGEKGFRAIEAEFLRENCVHPAIYSTGGGLPCFNGNMEYMNENGVTLKLDLPFDILWSRISNSSERPLVKQGKEKVFELFASRQPIYDQAQIVVDVKKWNASEKTALVEVLMDLD